MWFVFRVLVLFLLKDFSWAGISISVWNFVFVFGIGIGYWGQWTQLNVIGIQTIGPMFTLIASLLTLCTVANARHHEDQNQDPGSFFHCSLVWIKFTLISRDLSQDKLSEISISNPQFLVLLCRIFVINLSQVSVFDMWSSGDTNTFYGIQIEIQMIKIKFNRITCPRRT